MATKRSTIEIQVLGLEDLRSLNTAMATHEKRLTSLTSAYQSFNGSVGGIRSSVQQTTNTFNTFNTTINQTSASLQNASRSGGNMLTTFLQYRVLTGVFSELGRGIHAVIQEYAELEKQSARISRVAAPGQMGVIRAGMGEEAARTGASLKDIGEGYYQLGTRIKDTTALLQANRTAMNLVVGTEADSRETTRLMIQIHEQFGGQLGKNITEAESWRRVGELIAVSWKGASAETGEMANALKYLGPIAEAAKVPLEQVTGILSALTAEGVRGRMAGTEAGAFLTSIIKGYDEAAGGVSRGGKVFHFDLAKTAEGGIDLYKTLENIVKIANQLPTDKAREFLLGISGSQQSFRFLGTQGTESMREIREAIDQATKALQGQTHEAEKLKDAMMTTVQEGQRAFGGMFNALNAYVNASPLRGWLKSIADGFDEIAQRKLTAEQRSAEDSNTLYHGAPYQQSRIQNNTVRTVLGVLKSERQKYEAGGGDPNDFQQYANTALNNNTEYKALSDAQRNWWRTKFGVPGNAGATIPIYTMEQFLAQNERQESQLRSSLNQLHRQGLFRGAGDPEVTNGRLISEGKVSDFGGPADVREWNRNRRDSSGARTGDPGQTASGFYTGDKEHGEWVALPASVMKANGLHFGDTVSIVNERTGLTATGPIRDIGPAPHTGRVVDVSPDMMAAMKGRTDDVVKVIAGLASGGKIDPNKVITDKGGKGDADAIARDCETKEREALQDKMREAQANLAGLLHDFEGEGKPFSALLAAASPWLKQLDSAHAALAGKEGDREYQTLAGKFGLTDSARWIEANRDKYSEEAKQKAQDAAEKHADFTAYYAETALKSGSDLSFDSALEAQKAAIAAARLKGEDLQLRKLLDGATGPLADYKQQTQDERKDYEGSLAGRRQDFLDTYYGGVMKGVDRGLRNLDLGQRPNNFFRTQPEQQSDQEALLSGRVGVISKGISDLGPITSENRDKFEQLTQQLEEARKALTDFKDGVKAADFQKMLQRQEEAVTDAVAAAGDRHGPRGRQTEEDKLRLEMSKLAEIVRIREADVERMKALPDYAHKEQDVFEAERRAKTARRDYQRYPGQYYSERYNSQYAQTQGEVVGAGLDFFHGRGGIGDVAKKLGDTIVTTAQEQFLKQFTDPLTRTITNEVLALQGVHDASKMLTIAINANTRAIAGDSATSSAPSTCLLDTLKEGGPGAAGIVGGVAGGVLNAQDTHASGKQADKSYANFAKYAGAALGAYSIFSQGQQQGITAGNVLGGAAAGAGIGAAFGPGGAAIGAAAGGLLDVIGGLFHHSKPPDPHKEYNPALYNGADEMDYYAYRYRATGTLPTAKQMGIAMPSAAPIVNIYVDGVKKSVQTQLNAQMSPGNISQTNANLSYHEPL